MVKSGTVGEGSVAPFLKKCYEMVDDESTNSIISWGQDDSSFVIWNMTDFSVQLLPRYFKHNNSSSFIRQLNIYGFKKIDTDRWEFANDGFIRGQKHLLNAIARRKNSQVTENQKPSQQENKDPITHTKKDEHSRLWEEVENLKIDKNELVQDIDKLRQHHEISENKLLLLRNHLHGMEKNQQQMLSFLVMIMQNPGYLVQLLKLKENNWRMAQPVSIVEQDADDVIMPSASNGMIVPYQPPVNEIIPEQLPAPTLTGPENLQESNPSDFFLNIDFLKGLMDENIFPFENQTDTSILPELSDDHSWEQLLLFNPFLENAEDNNEREEGGNPDAEARTGTEKMKMH